VDKKNLMALSRIEHGLLGHMIYSRSIDWAVSDRNTDITTATTTAAAATAEST
jgi:hypothetical protein